MKTIKLNKMNAVEMAGMPDGKYTVTLRLIVGYQNGDLDFPITKNIDYSVIAGTEQQAIEKAKQLDKSGYSIWESYCERDEL